MKKAEGLRELGHLVDCYIGIGYEIDSRCSKKDFIGLMDFLKKISKESEAWSNSGHNKYLCKSIIIFYDSMKNLSSEEVEKIIPEKRNTIRKIIDKICDDNIKRKDFEIIYNSLLKSGFNIIPFPKINMVTPR